MPRFSLATLFMLVAVVGVLLTAVMRVPRILVSQGHTPSRRSICSSHMRQLVAALQCYHDQWGSFPPACTYDSSGNPMHSWRVHLLPYFECPQLYAKYDFSQPWNSPANWKVTESFPCPEVFQCPSGNAAPGETNYLAVVGNDAAWLDGKQISISDISDGTSETIFLAEVADSGIHWAEPRDLPLSQALLGVNPAHVKLGISSGHLKGAHVSFADGHVVSLSDGISPETFRAVLTRNGGEDVELPQW